MNKILATKLSAIAIGGLALLCSCNHSSNIQVANDPVYTDLDTTVKPGTDFFQYANGGWLRKHPIPPAYSGWGIGYLVNEELRDRLKKLNDEAVKANAPKGSDSQK